jgi:hypothetical protein
LYCLFDDPWESYCPWNFIIFARKFKTRKLFVVERWNQLECDQWPLTLKKGQGYLAIILFLFFSPEKQIYAFLRIEKLFWPFQSTCWKKLKSYALFVNFDLLQSYRNFCEKSLLSVFFKNRLLYMHENLCITRP